MKKKKRRENSIFGKIERRRFEGTDIRYEIRLENEGLVVAVRPALIEEWLDVQERVTVSFPVEKTLVFSFPEKGLKEALALE